MVGIKYGSSNIKNIRIGVEEAVQVTTTFNYTGSDQTYTAPATGNYTIEAYGAGSIDAVGGYAKGTVSLTAGTVLKIMVGQNGGATSSNTYGFGGSANTGTTKAGGGLSGVFTGSGAITASDSSRALVIGGGAGSGGGVRGAGGAGGGETGADGGSDGYGTAGSGGTQTGHGSNGNKGANQFNGGNGSGTYGYGGGGGRWGGNGVIGDTSVDDDKGGGGGSGYVISTATNRVLTQGGGSAINTHGKVIITGPGGTKQVVLKPIKEVYYGSKKIRPADLPSTVVCNFIASGGGATSLDTIKSTSFSHGNASSIASGSNGTVRYSISSTNVHAGIALGGYANNLGNNNGGEINRSSNLKQKLIKKAYLKISNLFYSTSGYPVFTPAGVYVEFSKPVISTNFTDYNASTSNVSRAGFIYPRGNNSGWPSYITYPVDSNTQYLALPTTPAGCGKTSTGYIDQGKSCLYSRVILEVKGNNASNFHYRLTVEETGNSYDLGLCSALGSCCIRVWSGDRWMVGAYKEVSEAYLEVYNDWYITETGAISQTKPR